MRLLISAGEASGDMYGAQLIRALRTRVPGMECFGMGGERMRDAECDLVVDAQRVAVVGLAEVVSHLPQIYGEYRKLLHKIDQRKPDGAVLIDFPDFHFRLARQLHARGIPVVYYVSPQIWAWRQSRVQLVKKYVRKMLVIFPFEPEFYKKHGVEAEFVGHPLAEISAPEMKREVFSAQTGADPAKPWIALLPGSRRKEFDLILPTVLEAASELGSDYEYVLPVASTLDRNWVEQRVAAERPTVKIAFCDNARVALHHARAAVVASGTATVEATMLGTPFVMVYRVSPLTWLLGRRMVKVDRFAMPNLIAQREVIPELVQNKFTSANIVRELRQILGDGPVRETMLAGLAEVRERLRSPGRPAAERAADAVLAALR